MLNGRKVVKRLRRPYQYCGLFKVKDFRGLLCSQLQKFRRKRKYQYRSPGAQVKVIKKEKKKMEILSSQGTRHVFYQIPSFHKEGNQTQNHKAACTKGMRACSSRAKHPFPGISLCVATLSISHRRRSPWEEKHQIGSHGSGVQEQARGRKVSWISVFRILLTSKTSTSIADNWLGGCFRVYSHACAWHFQHRPLKSKGPQSNLLGKETV